MVQTGLNKVAVPHFLFFFVAITILGITI